VDRFIPDALKEGLITDADVDTLLERTLRLRFELGKIRIVAAGGGAYGWLCRESFLKLLKTVILQASLTRSRTSPIGTTTWQKQSTQRAARL